MAENFVSREEYNKDIKRIDVKDKEQDQKVERNTNDITALKTIWANIAQMPDKIDNIEKNQIETKISIEADKKETLSSIKSIQDSLNSIASHNNEQDNKISSNEQRGKIDILKLVTDNAWKILVALASLIVGYNALIK